MSDFRKQVHSHYDKQSLPPEKVEEILANGRAVAGGEEVIIHPKKSQWMRNLMLLAALIVFAFVGIKWSQRDAGRVSYAALPPRVIEFFGSKPVLEKAPQDKKELKDWLLSKGAPSNFEIPASLAVLESAACQVVDVRDKKAYLSCYWREQGENRGDHELIHLLVARAADFKDQPASAQPIVREMDGWSFASWTKDEVIYTLATAAPAEKLTPFLSVNDLSTDSPLFTASIMMPAQE